MDSGCSNFPGKNNVPALAWKFVGLVPWLGNIRSTWGNCRQGHMYSSPRPDECLVGIDVRILFVQLEAGSRQLVSKTKDRLGFSSASCLCGVGRSLFVAARKHAVIRSQIAQDLLRRPFLTPTKTTETVSEFERLLQVTGPWKHKMRTLIFAVGLILGESGLRN